MCWRSYTSRQHSQLVFIGEFSVSIIRNGSGTVVSEKRIRQFMETSFLALDSSFLSHKYQVPMALSLLFFITRQNVWGIQENLLGRKNRETQEQELEFCGIMLMCWEGSGPSWLTGAMECSRGHQHRKCGQEYTKAEKLPSLRQTNLCLIYATPGF